MHAARVPDEFEGAMNEFPAELKQLPQWVVWRYELSATGKLTKIPYCVQTQKKADPTDYQTWTTFEDAYSCWQANQTHLAGIGFVLHEDDPFAVIDLDVKEGNQPNALQQQVYNAFETYAETSPSGRGLHIWLRGAVPRGLNNREHGIEVYSQARFMTVTGNMQRPGVPVDEHDKLNDLWAYLGGRQEIAANDPLIEHNKEQVESDDEICSRASNAKDGQKFLSLYNGEKIHGSQSEADLALVNMIAFYTQNVEQIRRIFLASALGKRDKAQRVKYVGDMIRKSFDQLPPEINLTMVKANMESQIQRMQSEATKTRTREREKTSLAILDNPFAEVPAGLVGDIARFIHSAATRPVPEIALYGALGLMAGICGRSYNVSGTGLNQYFLLLAKTGTGKEAAQGGITALMSQLKVRDMTGAAQQFIGPSFIASPQAIVKALAKTPCFVSIVGEFGQRLQMMTSRTASQAERGVMTAMLDLYGKSGKNNTSGAMAYSDTATNVAAVQSPAFTLMGEATPESFYEAIDERSIASGLVPRFTVIEYRGDRPEPNKHPAKATDEEYKTLLNRIHGLCGTALASQGQGQVVDVQSTAEASQRLDAFGLECDANIRRADNVYREVWNRAHLKVLKTSALLAVGVHVYNPCITLDQVEWCIRVEKYNIARMLEKFERGQVGQNTENAEQEKSVLDCFRTYMSSNYDKLNKSYSKRSTQYMHECKIMPWGVLTDVCAPRYCFRNDRIGCVNALKRTIQSLIDAGQIQEMHSSNATTRFGTHAKLYAWVGRNLFEE